MKSKKMQGRMLSKVSKIASIVGLSKRNVTDIITANIGKGDDIVLMAMCDARVDRSDSQSNDDGLTKRAQYRAIEIMKVFQGNYAGMTKNRSKLLDIGAGDGSITRAVGKQLGLTSDNIYGVDIQQWGTVEHKEPEGINFEFIESDNPIIPFDDRQFDCITVLQTMHHVQQLDIMMRELNRVTTPGGIVILREHDCDSMQLSWLIDLEHMMYDIVVDGSDIVEWRKTYYGQYQNKKEWSEIFKKFGFEWVPTRTIIRRNDTNYYYAMYQKVRTFVDRSEQL
jgi:ubiquinone/menaquinone biosynthesis C-methylase UbiE